MKNCAHCRARFGLIRHRYGLQQFCSKKCLAAFKLKFEVEIRQRQSWYEFLIGHAAAPPRSVMKLRRLK